ncbi:gamma-interferon-inducible lysosomal thiol reductase isoform X2 [Nilaparvata lugens]|uniref:gamma-interferon-inducible lysosomal thiol reductase isoform X1 n=1 Tax=Nilaparvata lugens TaxID=108931 RepID=UPI00193D837D|nr:gamma-interferon-inducible lysosomal thiol reductase isoform X1 [Nilaparvata lugens]XP_039287471.1 gamma-interferon-inducible lysosomal thiol reductase isoform X2 [Nilaparvata lugens]
MIPIQPYRLLWLACIFLQIFNAHSHSKEVVKVTVFYETLCPDCIDFFVGQIAPAWRDLKTHIKFDLVPYGHAKQNYTGEQWSFSCQHGEKECRYNKLHACFMKKEKSKNKLIPLLTCLMRDKDEGHNLKKCARKYKVNLSQIKSCWKGKEGDALLAKYGDRTHNFRPIIRFVPTIVFNGVFDRPSHEQALINLPKVVCKRLQKKPEVCEKYQ